MKLKKISEQVVVITGASSGIGLITARKMAQKGAKLVLAARSGQALEQLVAEITAEGGEAVAVTADVGREDDVRNISKVAQERFGGFDTWVNNAGISIIGRIEETPMEDNHRLFDTNFWGIVYGSLEAIKVLKSRGGALINLGSVVSERVAHPQGMYSTSKFAVKGFTDALRMELEEDSSPISVTLIQPSAMDTPFSLNAKNFTGKEFQLPPPVYSPDLVADAILHVAENPKRDIVIGGGGKILSKTEQFMPGLTDKVMESRAFTELQKKDSPASEHEHALYRPSERLLERGNYDGHVMKRSLYTTAALHPAATAVAAFTLGLGLMGLVRARQQTRLVPEQYRLPASTPESRRELAGITTS